MTGLYYTLDPNGEPVPTEDAQKWAEWFETSDVERVVAQKFFLAGGSDDEDISISTVFLGLNHGFRFTKDPLLWETMIFGGQLDGWQKRYSSRAAAIAGHAEALNLVNQSELSK